MASSQDINWESASRDDDNSAAAGSPVPPEAASELPKSSFQEGDTGPVWSDDTPEGVAPIAEIMGETEAGVAESAQPQSDANSESNAPTPEVAPPEPETEAPQIDTGLARLYEEHPQTFQKSYERAKQNEDAARVQKMDAARQAVDTRIKSEVEIAGQNAKRTNTGSRTRPREKTSVKDAGGGLGAAMQQGKQRKKAVRHQNALKRENNRRRRAGQPEVQSVQNNTSGGSELSTITIEMIADAVVNKLMKVMQEG